jgi:hypothetical protein
MFISQSTNQDEPSTEKINITLSIVSTSIYCISPMSIEVSLKISDNKLQDRIQSDSCQFT